MRLWIVLFIVGKKGSIGELLETRGVVGHDIVRTGEVPREVAVPMLPLVEGLHKAELGSWAVVRDSPFVNARLGGCVVREVADGRIGKLMGGGHEACLGDEATVFEVAVGDRAARIVSTDHLSADVLREGATPDEGLASGVEVQTSHANLGGVRRAQERRFLGNNLS